MISAWTQTFLLISSASMEKKHCQQLYFYQKKILELDFFSFGQNFPVFRTVLPLKSFSLLNLLLLYLPRTFVLSLLIAQPAFLFSPLQIKNIYIKTLTFKCAKSISVITTTSFNSHTFTLSSVHPRVSFHE